MKRPTPTGTKKPAQSTLAARLKRSVSWSLTCIVSISRPIPLPTVHHYFKWCACHLHSHYSFDFVIRAFRDIIHYPNQPQIKQKPFSRHSDKGRKLDKVYRLSGETEHYNGIIKSYPSAILKTKTRESHHGHQG